MTMNRFALTLTTLFLVGCGSEKDASDALPIIDNTAEVLAFYDAHADFFLERSIEELPENLVWEDGAYLPEVGSADAKKVARNTFGLRTSRERYGPSGQTRMEVSGPGF